MNYLYSEIIKQKKLRIIYISLGFILMSVLIGTGLFVANKEIMDRDKYHLLLWGQSAFYYSNLLAPILAGIVSSMVVLIDTNKKNFRRLKSVGLNLNKVIISKTIILFIYSLIIQNIFFIIFVISSKLVGVKINFIHMINFAKWTIYGAFAMCVIMSLAMCIFIVLNSFTATVGLTVVGTFVSFIILFINENISKYFPFSLLSIGMRSRTLINMNTYETIFFFVVNILFIIIFTSISSYKIKNII